MGLVTSLFARKIIAAAGEGVDAHALLASVGIDADGPWDPKEMVSAAAYYDLIEQIALQIDATDLPLRTGASMRLDEYGALGLAFKAATTLGASFARIERYARLWTDVVEYELRPHSEGTLLVLHRSGMRRLGLRLSNEATLASGVSIARQVSAAPVIPIEVLFRHDAPPRVESHEAWFGCPVRFNADCDAILFSPETLSQPNILGDEGISRFLTSHLEAELSAVTRDAALVAEAKSAIAQALSEGAPKMADIAQGLGFSQRSFHRRLADYDLNYQSLIERTRRELAEGLLKDNAYTLAEIAFLTGFSEQSAFSRAFKRWVGQTPANFRKHAGQR